MVAEGNAVGAIADPPPFWKAGPCLEDDPLAKNESCQAQVNVAVDRIPTDPVSAMAALRALAEQGSVYAMLQLAAACQESAKQANHKEAEFWWRRALAAGSPHAAFYLGALYRDDGDMDRACEAWTLGRTRGCAACANFLRETEEYQREKPYHAALQRAQAWRGTDLARAFAAYYELAERGSWNAMLQLGRAYRIGEGVARDPAQAEIWYRRVTDESQCDFKAAALYQLGWLSEDRHDDKEAHDWFQQSADLGYLPSLCHLGYQYWHGQGVEVQLERARVLFTEASERGHILATRHLAILLMSGRFGMREVLRGIGLFVRMARATIYAGVTSADDPRFLM